MQKTVSPTATTAIESFAMPEIEVKISKSWVRLIRWCQMNVPNGQVCFEIINSEPKNLVQRYTTRRIRFDREQDFPVEFDNSTG